jgi:hypothetical protein
MVGLLEGVFDFLAGLLELGRNLICLALSFEFVVTGRATYGLFALASEFFDLFLALSARLMAFSYPEPSRRWCPSVKDSWVGTVSPVRRCAERRR